MFEPIHSEKFHKDLSYFKQIKCWGLVLDTSKTKNKK